MAVRRGGVGRGGAEYWYPRVRRGSNMNVKSKQVRMGRLGRDDSVN